MWKTSIFADLSIPTDNKSTGSMYKTQLVSLGSNQEWFEESNPQGLQGPTRMKICRIKYHFHYTTLLLIQPLSICSLAPTMHLSTFLNQFMSSPNFPHHQRSNHQLLKYSASSTNFYTHVCPTSIQRLLPIASSAHATFDNQTQRSTQRPLLTGSSQNINAYS